MVMMGLLLGVWCCVERVAAMGLISLRVCGIWWRRWRWGVVSLSARMGAFVVHEVEEVLEVKSEGCD